MYHFLSGLNSEFDFLRSQILNQEYVPSLEQSVQKVLEEECRMQSTDAADDHGAGMAMKTVTPNTTP